MDREEIFSGLREILKTIEGHDDAVIDAATESSSLKNELGLNSIGMLYIMITIEEKFDVSFENTNANDFQTVGDVIDFIEANA
ncbi:MAG: acyl carrier protein [Lachnospiraceae bacterium]|nr:acyl carrier protein [Lachnospiraceae bacterium]